jgi:hypothetical protein
VGTGEGEKREKGDYASTCSAMAEQAMLHAATERPEGRDCRVCESRSNPGTSALKVSAGSPQGAA